ncbi:MAG: dihydroxyacetone kinase subunit DhaL [Synergistaceae bacterium]|nr:dihydroxyacetone kinase subunit DhaL [Synergistaceae bacterium]
MSGVSFKNANGYPVLAAMVEAIAREKVYLSDIDGLIGDGDHGVNMHKGFSKFGSTAGKDLSLSDGLDELGNILLSEIGGSMGPIYGTIFMGMAEACRDEEEIDAPTFLAMLEKARDELYDIVQARLGDKTLVDVLAPAIDAFSGAIAGGASFGDALREMTAAAERGRDSTKEMIARYGRSRALGERSRGVIDAGSASCCLLLSTMASTIGQMLGE